MKLEIIKKEVECPISKEKIRIDRCKNCSYFIKIIEGYLECEFK
jgi:hypothetical protein